MVADLALLGAGIALEPFRLSAFILILSTQGGTRKGLGFILGWLACLVVVIGGVVLIAGGRPISFHALPATAEQIAKLAAGAALILVAAVQSRRRRRPRILALVLKRLDSMSPWRAAMLGAVLQPWTLVAAGAITAVQARLPPVWDYLALVSFCLLATSSFVVLELYAVRAPEAARTRLAALRTWLETYSTRIIIVVCLGLGLWLTAQSIYELIRA